MRGGHAFLRRGYRIHLGLYDEKDIDLNRGYNETGADNDWRRAEQWLLHASWYLFAIALGSR